MVPLTTASDCFFVSPYLLPDMNTHSSPSWAFVFNPRRRTRKQEQVVSLNLVAAAKDREKDGSFIGFLEVNKRNYRDSCILCGGFVGRCKKDLDSEGDLALEAEILEFMRNSESPKAFPSKKQLMDAGRLDLVEAIARQGGWLAFGWDLDDDDDKKEEQQLDGFQENGVKDRDFAMVKEYKNGALQERVESGENSSAFEGNEFRRYEVSSFAVNSSGSTSWDLDDDDDKKEEQQLDGFQENGVKDRDFAMVKEYKNGALQERVESGENSSAFEGNEFRRYEVSSFAVNSSGSTSSSARALEEATEGDSGVEGILSRLEKERNINFGFGLREKGNAPCFQSYKDGWHAETSKQELLALEDRGSTKLASLNPGGGGIINDSGAKLTQNTSLSNLDGFKNSLKPEMWRTWSIQRAGFSEKEFEAAEIASNEGAMDVPGGEILEVREFGSEQLNSQEELNPYPLENNRNDIRSRLKHLELELSSALHTLRSNTGELLSQKGYEGSSDDLHKLSDAWEFQENEIMNAQDRSRSLRSKLAVLEGKMALAIIAAQKTVEERQKRIDDSRRALRLIRTACIVWPNSASEVLLVGSFDGWAFQRKMEMSNTGIFSLCLKLYPGKYEIKFIVDGEWKIDPLRPIVHNNRRENNLLIIT